jgi:hypothetical protein
MPDDVARELIAALEERGAPDAIAIADLMKLEQHLRDSLRIIQRQIDALVRRTAGEVGRVE